MTLYDRVRAMLMKRKYTKWAKETTVYQAMGGEGPDPCGQFIKDLANVLEQEIKDGK